MKPLFYTLNIRGKEHNWSFPVEAKPKHLQEWRDDGLDMDEVFNAVPMGIVNLGLTKPYCLMQDLGLLDIGQFVVGLAAGIVVMLIVG